jgi:hypothetical protein
MLLLLLLLLLLTPHGGEELGSAGRSDRHELVFVDHIESVATIGRPRAKSMIVEFDTYSTHNTVIPISADMV